MTQSEIQDTSVEICITASKVQQIAKHWRENNPDPTNLIQAIRAAAVTFNAMADMIEGRLDKPDIALTA